MGANGSTTSITTLTTTLPRRSLAAGRQCSYDKRRGILAQALWVAVNELVVIKVWCPNRLRCNILRWFGARIGRDVLIRHRVRVHWPWNLTVGDDSWIGTDVELYNLDDIVVGSDVCISQHTYLCTGSHDRFSAVFDFDNGPIVVEDGAWICARSTILRGVTIGANTVVGATCVITDDVPPNSIVRPPTPTVA